MESYYNNFPDGASNEDALLLLSQLHLELKSNQKAVKYLREFMKKYPRAKTPIAPKKSSLPSKKSAPPADL